MTATELVKAEIQKFLASKEPDVLCISGPWGVGKTYLWKDTLKKGPVPALPDYSYVSLFGLDSLEALKMSIYANQGKFAKTKAERWRDKIGATGKKAQPFLELTPYVGNLVKALGTLYFSQVKNQIICIDDLERRSKDLTVKDVMGLISFLKEERHCKVALLLNDGELDEEGSKDFRENFEKTIDVHVRFNATAAESTEAAFQAPDQLTSQLRDHCIALGINNIRIIRKIERGARQLQPMLADHDPDIIAASAKGITLLTWSHLKGTGAPTPEHLRERMGIITLALDKKNPPSEEQVKWNALLDAYGWGQLDDLDNEMMAGLQAGYFDAEKVRAAADKVQKVLMHHRQDGAFEQSWSGYHESFENNADAVLDNMFATFKRTFATISLMNVDGTVRLFRELGRNDQADELLRFYIDNRVEDQGFWDLDDNPFGGEVRDAAVRAAVKAKFESFGTLQLDFPALLEAMGSSGSWNTRDVDAAAALPVDEYKRVFREVRGRRLRRVVNGGLLGRRSLGGGASMKTVADKTVAALRELGGESEINKRRVEQLYGVPLNPPAIAEQGPADVVNVHDLGGVQIPEEPAQ